MSEIERLRHDVTRLSQALAAEVSENERLRKRIEGLEDALIRARDYIKGPMADRFGPMIRHIDAALKQEDE